MAARKILADMVRKILLLLVVTMAVLVQTGTDRTNKPPESTSPLAGTATVLSVPETLKGLNSYETPAPVEFDIVHPPPEGRILVSTQSNGLYSIASGGARAIDSEFGYSISPDGRYVGVYLKSLAALPGGRARGSPISFEDENGDVIRQVDDMVFMADGEAGWSPDGDTVVLARPTGEGRDLLDLGSGLTRHILEANSGILDWSGDGRTILFATSVGAEQTYGLLNLDTGLSQEIDPALGLGREMSLSPDGRFVSFMTGGAPSAPWRPAIYDSATGAHCLVDPPTRYVMKMGGSGGPRVTWAPDSRHVAITDGSGYARCASYTRLDVVEPISCAAQTLSEAVVGYAWNPTEESLALSVLKDTADWYAFHAGKADLNLWSASAGVRSLNIDAAWPRWTLDGSRILAFDGGTLRVVSSGSHDAVAIDLPLYTRIEAESPSGRYLLLSNTAGAHIESLYVADLETRRVELCAEATVGTGAYVEVEAWSP
jgi:hypothetical protein